MSKAEKRLREIESQLDGAMYNLPMYNINRDKALQLVASLYESLELSLQLQVIRSQDNPETLSEAEKKSEGLKGAFGTAIQHINNICPETEGEDGTGQPAIDQCIELLNTSSLYQYVEVNYKGIRPGILSPSLEEDSPDQITIAFRPVDDKIQRYEIMNEILIEENSRLYQDRMSAIKQALHRKYPKLMNWRMKDAYYSAIANSQTDLLFHFPDEMDLAGYKVKDIKHVWSKLLYKAYMASHAARKDCLPILDKIGVLPEHMLPNLLYFIHVDEFDGVDRHVVEAILDDLTFGTMKGKQKYGSLMTEPIIKLTDGARFVSPTFISHNLAGRNINATLNRIYAGTVDKDTVSKEAYFVHELEEVLRLFPTLKGGGPTQLPGDLPDVDYAIYDPISKTIAALEMKWITEPVTAQEIVSRDEDLYKGLHVQIPNYEAGITANLQSFMKKTFGEIDPVDHINYFVLTKISIGSGKINDGSNRIINIRMLKKALFDHGGNLYEATQSLRTGAYLPQENVHYKIIENRYPFAGVNFITCGKEVLEPFSLQTPDDLEFFPGKIE
ncbi:hypothetical protein [Paenibacillus sp. FSL W8-0194]|uniref:hypothetical protein n=1 Tax=Paenibacillus sp. FSL W8-0194 TaxID=2921711 RepID=UPI0030D9B387